MSDELRLIKGATSNELLEMLPAMCGLDEIVKMIRDEVLTPYLIYRAVIDPNSKNKYYRVKPGPPHKDFWLVRDQFDDLLFGPRIEPQEIENWAFSEDDIYAMCKLHPELGWPTMTSATESACFVDTKEHLELKRQLEEALNKNAALKEQVASLTQNSSMTITCEGTRKEWADSLNVILPAIFSLTESETGTLIKDRYFKELLKQAPCPVLKSVYDLVWRSVPNRFKQGRGRPAKHF